MSFMLPDATLQLQLIFAMMSGAVHPDFLLEFWMFIIKAESGNN